MASIYMRIDTKKIEGGATIDGLDGDGWFALSSFSWGGMRNVNMDIGDSNNTDSGMVACSEVSVSKQIDGASESLSSFLFSPGNKGKTVEIVFTKPKRSGEGAEVVFQVKLEEARLVSYNISGSDGGQPYESMTVAYSTILQKHNIETTSGELKKGGTVAYDMRAGKMTSGIKG